MLSDFLRSVPLSLFISFVIGLCAVYLVLPPRGLIAAGFGHAGIAVYGIVNAGELSILLRVWLLHLAGLWLLVVMGLDLATDDPELPSPDDDSVNARATRLAYQLVDRTKVAAVERSAALGNGLGTLLVTSLEEILGGYDQAENRGKPRSARFEDNQEEQHLHTPPQLDGDGIEHQSATDPRSDTSEQSPSQEPAGWDDILVDESETPTDGVLLPSDTGSDTYSETEAPDRFFDEDGDD